MHTIDDPNVYNYSIRFHTWMVWENIAVVSRDRCPKALPWYSREFTTCLGQAGWINGQAWPG